MQKMMLAGALLLALGGASAASADSTPAAVPAAAATVTAEAATAKATLGVVSGAKALSANQKADVDGGQQCVTTTTHYYVWVFGWHEYYTTTRTVCDVDL